ncbi:MAG: SH3 domain-containing protein [Gammaproteobacteria bacterium]|nr:SH3 domain-containing protein [Gammaproteobacteria bacterium]
MHLTVDFWIDRTPQVDELLAVPADIARIVSGAFDNDPNMVDLAAYPDTLPGADVAARIHAISKPYSQELFYRDGRAVSAADYERYSRNLNLDRLPDQVYVRLGMVLRRADMRTWPTQDVVFKTQETFDLDRFQENGLFPADVVAVLHESADGQWYFVQSYNYAAWVLKEKIVTGDREPILQYRDADNFLVVAGGKVTTNFNPKVAAISELQLDMGVRLPLLDPDRIERNIDGQNTKSSYPVLLPARSENGELEFRTVLIARNQDVCVGYMPYTRRNILHQSFKFLGERYGWGHSYNARDCSGLVMEVYKTFGILLPRNSAQQRNSPIGNNTFFGAGDSAAEKLKVLAACDVGDLLYCPGHVMLYLGTVDGEPYVIHSLFGAGWAEEDGSFQEGVLNGVAVTPLRQIYMSPEATYFDQLYSIKQIR